MKYIFILLIVLAEPVMAGSYTRHVTEVGTWSTGNHIFYLRIDGDPVGPVECQGNFLKVYLGEQDMQAYKISALNTVRAIALAAVTSGKRVSVNVPDEAESCVHDSPTFLGLNIKSN